LLAVPALLAHALLAQTAEASASATVPHQHTRKPQKQLVLPPLPRGPLSPLPMDQLPPAPARVSYQGGLLSISAQNSTLGEILRDVRKLTGASIEIPQGSGANERVVTHLGPGAPRDVLAGLFNGSSFNYVMLGSSSDPTAVSSVILTAKPSSSGDTQAAPTVAANVNEEIPGPPHPIPPRPVQFLGQVPPHRGNGQAGVTQTPEGDDSKDKDDDDKDDDSADDPAQPDATGANAQDQQQQPDPNQPNAGPKTPEQILEMMRRQQQPPAVPPQTPPQQ